MSDGSNLTARKKNRINVLIAHADAIVRAGMGALLAAQTDLRLTIATDDNMAIPADSDVIILDHNSAMRHTRHGRSRVLVVTQLDREWDVYTAMTSGVHGYLLQSAGAGELLTAVRMLSNGMHYLSAALHDRVIDSATRIELTSRETDVLELLAQGLCNKLIARELGIGVGTVKTHIRGVCDKLGATARTHAVVLAIRRGLVASA